MYVSNTEDDLNHNVCNCQLLLIIRTSILPANQYKF